MKPAIKEAFYIKEQRWNDAEKFVEPDDEIYKNKDTCSHVADYLKLYKNNPSFIEGKDLKKRVL